MAADNDITLPKIPDGEGEPAYISLPEWDEVVPNLGELLIGPDEIDVQSIAFSPAVVPAVVAGYALGGDKTVSEIERIIEKRAQRNNETGKISKYDSYYLPRSPLVYGVWEYKCRTCRFYQPDADGDGNAKCQVVGQEGDIAGGENVHPDAWCALWLPQDGRGWLEYATDRLEGEA